MQDKELYQQILGLSSPWAVADVQLDLEAQEIRIRVEHPRGAKFRCCECESECLIHDHADERRRRHLDSCQFKTVLVATPPRVKCPTHGVKNAVLPWAEKGSRFTMLFERFAIDVMLACQTVKGAQGILRTSWDETWHILKKAVARGKARKTDNAMPRIGIDEKAFRKGQSYITMIYDLDNSTVEAIYSQELETGKAWAYKEMLGDLWHHDDAASATVFFKDWYKRVIHTKLTPLKKVAQTIRDRLVNVVSYCTHGITNAVAEGMNSKIMSIKRRVGGYRHRENFKTAIYFHCGGLDLYPR